MKQIDSIDELLPLVQQYNTSTNTKDNWKMSYIKIKIRGRWRTLSKLSTSYSHVYYDDHDQFYWANRKKTGRIQFFLGRSLDSPCQEEAECKLGDPHSSCLQVRKIPSSNLGGYFVLLCHQHCWHYFVLHCDQHHYHHENRDNHQHRHHLENSGNRHYYQTLPFRKWTTGASVDASLNTKSLFNRTSRYASRYQTYLIFHHQQGRIEFITVNTHQPTGKDFLIHP